MTSPTSEQVAEADLRAVLQALSDAQGEVERLNERERTLERDYAEECGNTFAADTRAEAAEAVLVQADIAVEAAEADNASLRAKVERLTEEVEVLNADRRRRLYLIAAASLPQEPDHD